MKARLLDMGIVSPLRSQSIYHGVTEAMNPDSDIAISIMRPSKPYVSVGYFQETEREVDLAYCESRRMPVYRRHVGGGAVLLDGNQLVFHVMVPIPRAREFGLPERLADRFAHLARPPLLAYRRLGVEAAFRPVNDIQVRGRKIGGIGVGELGQGLVFAGSMMLDFDTELMVKVLRIPDDSMRDKVFQSPHPCMTSLAKELGAKPEAAEVAEALITAFEEAFGLELVPAALTTDELSAVERWDSILADPEWLHQVRLKGQHPRAVKMSERIRVLQAERQAPGGMLRLTLRTVDGRIAEMLLSGDFPASPQDALTGFSQAFLDAPLDRAELKARLHAALAANPLDLAGVEESDLNLLMEQVTH